MSKLSPGDQINQLLKDNKSFVIIQADNPDGDSLASALVLEQILGDMGKQVFLYCGVDIPDYLKHLPGWDRISKDIPNNFDASIIVDTSAALLLEKLSSSKHKGSVASRPAAVIDHHADVKCDIAFASIIHNDSEAVATGEAIYKLAQKFDWPLNLEAKTFIASSILSDSLGLTSEGTSAQTYRIMSELIESGVNRPELEEARKALSKMPEVIFRYKAALIERTELFAGNKLAIVVVPNDEIATYSPLYNPAPLIQTDMLNIEGVVVAIVLKSYKDGKVTGSIRCGFNTRIAGDLAATFGGGGHSYAAGFKTTSGKSIDTVKSEVVELAEKLLNISNDKTI